MNTVVALFQITNKGSQGPLILFKGGMNGHSAWQWAPSLANNVRSVWRHRCLSMIQRCKHCHKWALQRLYRNDCLTRCRHNIDTGTGHIKRMRARPAIANITASHASGTKAMFECSHVRLSPAMWDDAATTTLVVADCRYQSRHRSAGRK